MVDRLTVFEEIARRVPALGEAVPAPGPAGPLHPFEVWNLHPALPLKVRRLFDDAHYAEATFAACKYLEQLIAGLSEINKTGEKLMMAAFNEDAPQIRLTPLTTESDRDEQRGYRHIFSGLIVGIRNPRGHETSAADQIDTCLEHLVLVSHLVRRLERAGYQVVPPNTR